MQMRRIALLLVSVVLGLSILSPVAQSSNYKGNEYMQNGGDNVALAIALNMGDLLKRTVADFYGIPLSAEDLVEDQLTKPLEQVPGGKQFLIVLSFSENTLEAYVDLGNALGELSKAKRDLYNALMDSSMDYMEGTVRLMKAIQERARQDAISGTPMDEKLFVNFDKVMDGSDLAKRIRNHSKDIIFFFDKPSRVRLQSAADSVEQLSKAYRNIGYKQMYQLAREQKEKELAASRQQEPVGQPQQPVAEPQPPAVNQPHQQSVVEQRRDAYVFNTGNIGLKLRDIPSPNAKQLAGILDGSKITVIGDGPSNGYYKIEYNGIVGWGTAEYIRIAATPEQRRNAYVFNTGNIGLKLRDVPAANARQLAGILDGSRIIVIGDGPSNGYYKIEYNGIVGWGTAEYIRIEGAASAGGASQAKFIWPVPESKLITNGYGGEHGGLDIGNPGYSPTIVAAASGVVVTSISNCVVGDTKCGSTFGNYVMIKHDINGQIYYTYYAHLKQNSVKVKENDWVEAGTEIGVMGNTGYSFGVHLHMEVRVGGTSSSNRQDPIEHLAIPQDVRLGTGVSESYKKKVNDLK
jgi:murein DD-endopeptidase MepM/ murein hydrolase activator NlpD